MFYRVIFLLLIVGSSVLNATTATTIADGDWEDANVWSTHQVPVNPDSIIVSHYIVLNQNRTISAPTVLYINALGTLCGEYLLETLCNASFINYGHLFLGQIKTRSGLNYHVIECKNYMIISGCSPPASGFSSLPPNGSVAVWPPVLCKTIDTNWELGNQIGLIELQNNVLKIYPNPISNEPLHIETLSYTKMSLTTITGSAIEQQHFDYRTEIDFNKLPFGVYFLELEIDGKKTVKKIIKTN